MEKNKISSHGYTTRRNKIPKLEENNENSPKSLSVLSKTKNAESPLAAKFCMISGYASPPCRHGTLSQQNEEIGWDLTSPSARKFQEMVSDKRTSTPNQTPTRRNGQLRPRITLCKKNIAMTEDKSGELVNELAVLNDMVNQKEQTIMTPPQSVKRQSTGDCESPVENSRPVIPTNLNTSDVFDDDSFFSESILLSTQALEEEAIGCNTTCLNIKSKTDLNESLMNLNTSNKSFPLVQQTEQTLGGDVSRRSFDLDAEESAPSLLKDDLTLGSTKISTPKFSVKTADLRSKPQSCANPFPLPKASKPDTFNPPAKTVVPKTQLNNHYNQPSKKIETTKLHQPIPPDERREKNTKQVSSRPQEYLPVSYSGMGIKRIVDKPIAVNVCQKSIPATTSSVTCRKSSPPNRSNAQSVDPFDDDDDDLLCAIAEEIESQYVSVSAANRSPLEDEDDGFFQPDVLEYISQIETRITSIQKSTADLLEEKRQAAIRKRKERLMNRR